MAGHVCPWWVGYLLINPLRRIYQSPEKVLGDYVRPGMTVLEIGPGMGYFSLWMAKAVTDTGRVVCVDVQERMIRTLRRRVAKAGLDARVDARVCSPDNLHVQNLSGQVDFALVFAVLHEVSDVASVLGQIHAALKPGAPVLISEPTGHVSADEFDKTEKKILAAGLEPIDRPEIFRSRSILVRRAAEK